MLKIRHALLLPLAGVALTQLIACTTSDDPTVVSGSGANGGLLPNTSAATTNTSSTSGGATSTGTQFVSTTGSISPLTNGSGGQTSTVTGDLKPDDVCGAVNLETEPVVTEVETIIETEVPAPVAIYFVLDNSLSMNSRPTDPAAMTKWEEAVQALTNFVNDSASAGVDVGLQYFNPPGMGDMTTLCDGTVHGTPAVPVAPLPDNAMAMVDSLTTTTPERNTPTVGALSGGTAFCDSFQQQNPDYQCIVVLVTDGQPNDCGLAAACMGGGGQNCVDPQSEATLTPIAAGGLTADVTTFTVGMAGVTAEGFTLLNAIAVAGGSDCTPDEPGLEACDVSMSGASGLLEALNTIRDTVTITETMTETVTEIVALPCQWQIPDPPEGETFDRNLVNVAIGFDGAPGEPLGRVPSEADCASVSEGWYYDNPEIPTSILVCPQTCDLVKSNGSVTVEVQLGCETEIAIK